MHALAKTRNVAGDVCEFGVAQGETCPLIANEIIETDKVLPLFDSFQGLPPPTAQDQLKDDIFDLGAMEAYTVTMALPESMVRARLAAVGFPPSRFRIHRGFIEELIQVDPDLPREVSFAYLDFDLYEPIKIGLEFLHNVVRSGSILIVDDYDFFSTGVKTAVDEFVQEKNAEEKHYQIEVAD